MSVYAYGMCVWSTVHRVDGCLPPGDGYGEILESWSVPAGEAANGAILMSHWGEDVELAGALLGADTRAPLLGALASHGVGVGRLEYDPSFAGFRDLVLTNGTARSVYGRFRRDLSAAPKRWAPPDRQALARARMALVDPCFGPDSRLAAEYCRELGTPHVVLDCRHDDPLHRHAAATVLSHEFLRAEYATSSAEDLLALYTSAAHGLTVITQGRQAVRFARSGSQRQQRDVVAVTAKSTIGAGDAFRAGIAYGLMLGWNDDKVIRFAIGAAAAVCCRGPIAASPPSLDDIAALA